MLTALFDPYLTAIINTMPYFHLTQFSVAMGMVSLIVSVSLTRFQTQMTLKSYFTIFFWEKKDD